MLTHPNRREIAASLLALGLPSSRARGAPSSRIALGPAQPFSFDSLKLNARALAARPHAAPTHPEDDILQAIDYDAYGQIAFKPEKALWAGDKDAAAVRLFPLGRYFKQPVAIHVLEDGQARPVLYSPDLFAIPQGNPARRLKTGGFAGFRLMNGALDSDWLAFLGASYFRASGPMDQYGASARGLAINAGGPEPEEFPRFSAFWLEQLGHGAVRAYALLEGPSVAGAFRIDNRKGAEGVVQDIAAQLHFRSPVATLGLAPLTSMFWYGQNASGQRRDWRPQIHDSDGLALWTGAGERIWRPLTDPDSASTSSFQDQDPKGFGLIQRDRDFRDYQDDSVFYERRPSLWVEPASSWGRGQVRLVELPTTDETNDNIVAFWTPAAPVRAGEVLDAAYRLTWGIDAPPYGDVGRIVATRLGRGGRPGVKPQAGAVKFVIDVQGRALEGMARDSGVQAVVETSLGGVDAVAAYPVVGTKLWRIMFDLTAPPGRDVDLRAYLRRGGQALSETWLYKARIPPAG